MLAESMSVCLCLSFCVLMYVYMNVYLNVGMSICLYLPTYLTKLYVAGTSRRVELDYLVYAGGGVRRRSGRLAGETGTLA